MSTGKTPRDRVVSRWFLVLATILVGGRGAMAVEPPASVIAAEQQRVSAVARACQSAVCIFTPNGNGGGSGVVISADGYAVSNYHVTSPVGDYLKCGMNDGRLYDAVIVSIDPTGDLAVIKLLGRNDFVPAVLGDSDQVRAGDWCFAVGNPFLLATDFHPTVSFGLVSGTHRYQYPAGSILEYADCIQTDAAINPGNSGGPLFNAAGHLIGIVGRGSFEKRGRVNVGVGYAISVNQVKNFLGHLRSGMLVDHATLGATVDRDENGKVVVSNILESSDAYRRGLRYGDELVSFGGRPISSVNAFKNVLGIYPSGWRVPLSYRRDGVKVDTYVRLTNLHTRAELQKLLQQGAEEEVPEEHRPVPEGQPRPVPERKPGQEPKPGSPPKSRPRPSSPHSDGDATDVVIPEEAAKLIVHRPGFKNYYFNEWNRQRVWSQSQRQGDFSGRGGPWSLKGKLAAGGDFEVVLASDISRITMPGIQGEVVDAKDLHEQLEPSGTGALAALHLWRQMLVLGPQKFGDVRYVGTAPVPGHPGLFDVLAVTRNVTESWLYFDPRTSQLVAMETFPDPEIDPCELLFREYRAVQGVQFPHVIVGRRGGEVLFEWRMTEIKLP